MPMHPSVLRPIAILGVVLQLALPGSSALAQTRARQMLVSVRLSAAGHPGIAADVAWERERGHDGMIDVGIDSALFETGAGNPEVALLLQVRAAEPGARIAVRQRSVSYLNISGEGPHVAVPGTEARGPWSALAAGPPGAFRVHNTVGQPVRVDHRQLAAALAGQPAWLALAQGCQGPDDGACYTVTDPEFEITVTGADGRSARAIVRVFFHNGC